MPDPQSELTDETGFLLALTVAEELSNFEVAFAEWLQSPHGRFEQYYAARERLLAT